MNAVVFFDFVELVSGLAALVFLTRVSVRKIGGEIRLLLSLILIFKVYHGFSNVLQWGGITVALDEWEDYLEILVPVLWAGVVALYSIFHSENRALARAARFRKLHESMGDMFLVFEVQDGKPGRVREVNRAFLERTGYTEDEVRKTEPARFFSARSDGGSVPELLASEDSTTTETELKTCLDIPVIDVEIHAHLIDYEGHPAVMATMRDISASRRAEKDMRRAKEDLEKQNEELKKIDGMKDALISDVSHELKTPVAKHAMQIEVLRSVLERDGMTGKYGDILDVIEGGVRRQQSTIRNILMLSRLEAGGRTFTAETVRIDRLLDAVVEEYSHALTAYGMQLEMTTGPVTVSADEEMLWHVFSNILGNAVKYRRGDRPRVAIRVEENEKISVVFEDNGLGMTPAEQKRAFDRFYQASPAAEGIGLGLNIAHIILEKYGGTIELSSEGRNRGTTARVVFAPGP